MSGSFLSETASEADSDRLSAWEEESIQAEEELVLSRVTSLDRDVEADVEWSSSEDELAKSADSLSVDEEITPRAVRSRTVIGRSALSSRDSSVDASK